MTFIRYKKRGSKWYVYEVTAFWDQSAKKPKQKTKYLGTASTKGGEIIQREKGRPSVEKAILDFGDTYVIREISRDIGLTDILKTHFSDFDSLITLLCYQMTEGSSMYNCKDWAEGNIACKLFPRSKLDSRDISKLINLLGREDIQRAFFKSYISHFFNTPNNVLIDSTSLPSSINNSLNAWGHSPEGIIQKIGCLMLVDKASKLPIYFRAIPGDIVDVSTLKVTVEEIYRLGLAIDSTILDAGYFSEENMKYLCQENINFITRMPKSRKQFNLNSAKNRHYAAL